MRACTLFVRGRKTSAQLSTTQEIRWPKASAQSKMSPNMLLTPKITRSLMRYHLKSAFPEFRFRPPQLCGFPAAMTTRLHPRVGNRCHVQIWEQTIFPVFGLKTRGTDGEVISPGGAGGVREASQGSRRAELERRLN